MSASLHLQRVASFWIVLLGSILASAQESTKELTLSDLVERSEICCVRIDVQYQDGRKGIGSGFVGDATRKWIVTNYHVVADSKSATVTFSNGDTAEVEGWRAHYTERDLALLQIKTDRELTALTIASALPRKGERAVAIGNPQGLSFTATEGIISAIRDGTELHQFFSPDGAETNPERSKFKLVGKWLQTSTPISAGSSGGPLLNMRGEVVGVNSGSLASGQNINFAVSCIEIQKLINVGKRIKLRDLSLLTPASKTIFGSPQQQQSDSENLVIQLPSKRRFRHNFKIEKIEDEFDKITVLRTAWLPVDHNNRELTSLGLRISVVFNDKAVMPLVVWEVGVTSANFQFDQLDGRFQVLGGEESYELLTGQPEAKIEPGLGTSQVFKGVMALDNFVAVVLTDKVKARLGATEMNLNDRQIECVRDLASQIPEGKFFDGRLQIDRLKPEDDPTTRRKR